ncbi:MAG: glucose-1-phosphate thymidyltransferase, partial [Deltaproteobacteria bacterium]|nr:glucose-1-phosphate thymidyltransferase [Deltaproteobacteria bacterium]
AQVSYVEQPQPRGLAHAAQCARAFVGSDPFVMYLGDNLIPEGLTGAADHFKRSGANAVVMLKAVDDPTQFGIAQLDGDRIVRLIEKPKNPPTNLAIVGGYFFDHHIFESIDRIKPSWRNEYEITDAIQDLIDRGLNVVPYVVTGWWKDAGKPNDILEANQVMLQKIGTAIQGKLDSSSIIEGPVCIGPDTEVSGSKIVGPVIIGAESRIIDAEIGPFASIGDRVHVIGSRIADSVVMDDTVIQHVRQPVVRSLLGRRVQLTGNVAGQAGIRLVLGDFCETELP